MFEAIPITLNSSSNLNPNMMSFKNCKYSIVNEKLAIIFKKMKNFKRLFCPYFALSNMFNV